MNNVINLKAHEHIETETAFVELLDNHCAQEGAVKPLSNELFERIEQLKLKAEAAKQKW